MKHVDYLGWELERQRAALWALLGGGETEEREASGEKSPAWEEFSGWEDQAPADGTRRSPESLEKARRRGSGRTGRYAAGRGEAGGPLMGAPGAWEMVQEADWTALAGGSDGLPVSVALQSGEAGSPARGRRDAETGVSPLSRRYAPEERRRTPRIGTGGAAGLRGSSSGQRDYVEEWETADGTGAEAAAEAAGKRRTGEDFAEWGPAVESDRVLSPREKTGGGGMAGGAVRGVSGEVSAAISRDGAGMIWPIGGGLAGTAGRGERLSRALPWGEGWESPALRAEDGAKALSRAVQRDARRYDGGFTIY